MGALVGASALVGLAPAAAAAPPTPVEPLEVTIETLTPGDLPAEGEIEVSGTVTNVDDETWTTVNLYPVVSDAPMRVNNDGNIKRRVEFLPQNMISEELVPAGGA